MDFPFHNIMSLFCVLQEQGGVALVAAGSPGSEGSPGLTSPACEKRKAEEDTSSDLKKVGDPS